MQNNLFNLDQALFAINGREEFIVKRHDGLVIINYLIQLPDSFDGIRQEFRGITFNEKTGDIVSLPLHKFKNINQSPETQWELIKDLTGKIYEKVDGSSVHFFEWKGEIRASTRMGDTEQAQKAYSLAKKLNLLDAIAKDVRSGYTPIFEYCSPDNQIVVFHPKQRLIYLHSRDIKTGIYTRNPIFIDRAKEYDIKFSDIMNHLDFTEFEGYVACLGNLWVKCKTPWYMERHRAVDALMRPAYKLYGIVFEGVMDDLIAVAPDRFKSKLTDIYTEAQLDLLRENIRVESLFAESLSLISDGKREDKSFRKAFVQHIQQNQKQDFHCLMTLYDNRDPSKHLKERLMNGYKIKYPNRLYQELLENDS